MSTQRDHHFMNMALALGRRGMGQVSPWPSVGCVIVGDGRVVGRGRSDPATMRHAERVALDQAGNQAQGATVYVTLEPCAHHGRTPPCCDTLIAAGVGRVVIATGDLNPSVAGEGIRRIHAAGIPVEMGCCEQAAKADHAGFLSVHERDRPYVTLKLATTLDGKIATSSGESQWITGAASRRHVHLQRARHDAVMAGAGTVRADDPSLTVRDFGDVRQPAHVIVSRDAELPTGSKIEHMAKGIPTYICCAQASEKSVQTWAEKGVDVIVCGETARGVDLNAALSGLAKAGLTRVYCEGGGQLAASLLTADLVDEMAVYSAGRIFGADGRASVAEFGLGPLEHAPKFKLISVENIGADIMSRWVKTENKGEPDV